MNTKVFTQTSLEVIGFGEMPSEPTQIGQWWVVPASQYHSTIPEEAWQKARVLAQSMKVTGFVVMDDMSDPKCQERMRDWCHEKEQREQEIKEKQKHVLISKAEEEAKRKEQQEQLKKDLLTIGKYLLIACVVVVALPAAVMLVGLMALGSGADPVLVAVLDDGRWVCVHSWYD